MSDNENTKKILDKLQEDLKNASKPENLPEGIERGADLASDLTKKILNLSKTTMEELERSGTRSDIAMSSMIAGITTAYGMLLAFGMLAADAGKADELIVQSMNFARDTAMSVYEDMRDKD